MNIVVVSQHFQVGGLETHLLGFLRQVQSRGHRVSLVTGADARLAPLRELIGERILTLPFHHALSGAEALQAADRIAAFCQQQQCDLLHLQPFITLHVGALAAARARLPFVLTLHGKISLDCPYGPPESFLLTQMVLGGANRVYCVARDLLERALSQQPEARYALLSNAVDPAIFRATKRDPQGPWAVIARLESEKIVGVRQTLEMLSALLGPSFRARVFGDGSLRTQLAEWIASQPYAGCVSLEGHTDSLHEVLREGFAGVAGRARILLEAGAMGLPVLLAGAEGVKGLVRRGQMAALRQNNFSGRGFPLANAEMLAEQLRELAVQPQEYDLRPWIEEHANESLVWESYLREIENLPAPNFMWPHLLIRLIEKQPQRQLFSLETLLELIAVGRELRTIPNGYLWLAEKEQALAEKATALAAEQQALAEKEQALMEKRLTATEKDEALAAQKQVLAEKEQALAEKAAALIREQQALTEREQALAEKEQARAEKEQALAEKEQALAEISQVGQLLLRSEQELASIHRSKGWRLLSVYWRVRDTARRITK
jgi:glycosyltransferase involved in cell wall biosynthesis